MRPSDARRRHDDHARRMNGNVRGMSVPADAWERIFGKPESEPEGKEPEPDQED